MMEEEHADTALHEAVRYCDIDDVREALTDGHDPNQIGLYQWSALHEAVSNGDADIVKLLLKHGGDPNTPDALRGCTAVHYAARRGWATVLEALLDAGGHYAAVNHDGHTPLDEATSDDCVKLLRQQRNDSVQYNTPKEVILQHVEQDIQLHLNNHNNLYNSTIENWEAESAVSVDEISVVSSVPSSPSCRPPRAWDAPRHAALGVIQLSFEYNSKRSSFKVRVWQLKDLLMPPPDSSMINSVYVKSFLQPDDDKSTKRKTEEIKLSNTIYRGVTGSVDFVPATFSFTRPLEYNDITPQRIRDTHIHIEVCVVQRYTRRSFVICSVAMPTRAAVKRLLKEKFSLTPRSGARLPENMAVYGSAGSMLADDTRSVHSHPEHLLTRAGSSLSRSSSRSLWGAVPYRPPSDPGADLASVTSTPEPRRSHIEVALPEAEELELQDALTQIAVMERTERAEEETTVDMPGRLLPGCLGYDDTDEADVTQVQVHTTGNSERSGLLTRSVWSRKSRDKYVVDAGALAQRGRSRRHDDSPSRHSETSYAGDYYEDTPTFSSILNQDTNIDDNFADILVPEESGLKQSESSTTAVLLPVATSLQLRERHTASPDDNMEMATFTTNASGKAPVDDEESTFGMRVMDRRKEEEEKKATMERKQRKQRRIVLDEESSIGDSALTNRGTMNDKTGLSIVNDNIGNSSDVRNTSCDLKKSDEELPKIHRKVRARPKNT